MEIDQLHLLDIDHAIEVIGDESILYDMLGQFIEMNKPALESLKKAMETHDVKTLRENAHSLKGATSYICANKVSAIAKYMQDSCDHNNPEEAVKQYPCLIFELVNTNREIRKSLEKKKGIVVIRSKC